MTTYENEVDDYGQTHYQLHYTKQLNSNSNYNLSFHYTKGAGYYEQFRSKEKRKASILKIYMITVYLHLLSIMIP